MPHNYPFTAIHFKINPSILDVNVHPTKMELRFSKNEFVYSFVLDTVRNTLRSGELAAQVKLPEPKVYDGADTASERTSSLSGKNLKDESPDDNSRCGTPVSPVIENKKSPQKFKERLPEPFELKRSMDLIQEDNKAAEYAKKTEEPVQASLFDSPLMEAKSPDEYRIIGQLFETYWLIEYGDKFYMMDQHAAHEKILYERFMKHLKEKDMDTQMIMPPVIIELTMQQENAYRQHKKAFERLGFEIEEFGGGSYKVTGLPAGLPNVNLKQMLIDMIDGLTSDSHTDLDIITERVATMSCKAAVKGSNKLSFEEARELIQELMQAENPYNCPHGRPTLIVMSKYEVEKKFKRIL